MNLTEHTVLEDLFHHRSFLFRQFVDEISKENAEALTWAHKFLIAHGWTRVRDNRISAMFEKQYNRGDKTVFIKGWHGTGKPGTNRHYGNLKLIFSFSSYTTIGIPVDASTVERARLDTSKATVADVKPFLAKFKDHIIWTCT